MCFMARHVVWLGGCLLWAWKSMCVVFCCVQYLLLSIRSSWSMMLSRSAISDCIFCLLALLITDRGRLASLIQQWTCLFLLSFQSLSISCIWMLSCYLHMHFFFFFLFFFCQRACSLVRERVRMRVRKCPQWLMACCRFLVLCTARPAPAVHVGYRDVFLENWSP